MEASPPRDDDGDEKLDGGGSVSAKTAAALRNSARAARVCVGARAASCGATYRVRAGAESERRRGSRSGRCGPSPIRPEVGGDPPVSGSGRQAGCGRCGWCCWAAAGPQRGEGRARLLGWGEKPAQRGRLPLFFFFFFNRFLLFIFFLAPKLKQA